jgi:hypothetical protein
MMVTVDALGDDEQGWVWRCYECALAFVDGEWCRLGQNQWIPLAVMPDGPFFRIEDPVFGDYRNQILRGATK